MRKVGAVIEDFEGQNISSFCRLGSLSLVHKENRMQEVSRDEKRGGVQHDEINTFEGRL